MEPGCPTPIYFLSKKLNMFCKTMSKHCVLVLLFMLIYPRMIWSQDIPAVYSNMEVKDGVIQLVTKDGLAYAQPEYTEYGLTRMKGAPEGTEKGIAFNFGEGFSGKLYFGFIPFGDSKHPLPVYFRRFELIRNGQAEIKITDYLKGTYDMVGWEASKKGTLGYRVVDTTGQFIYDGVVSFIGNGPFEIDETIVEGPFVNRVTPHGATISFQTNEKTKAIVQAGPIEVKESRATQNHEVVINGLEPDSLYAYQVRVGDNRFNYEFRTAPLPGSRKPFSFAYASDSRSGQGGGERSIYGANAYIMKKIMSLAQFKDAAFMQFSGDLINGYLSSVEDMNLQYANWKKAIQPFAHYFPVYVSMGNHESLVKVLVDNENQQTYLIDKFPFDTESAEKVFADNFVNPQNGPSSEDGAYYDPDPKRTDFPSYDENVFYYTYDNVAVIVLNSDYFYAPTTTQIRKTSGGLHGYIMDNQLAWLDQTVATLEADQNIDHVFLTQHTPCFPNGGHVRDDMWYSGNNQIRPYVAGKAVRKGIIERRDEILDIIVNKSSKVRAILTGDEHNYNRLKLTPETQIYPENYFFPKIELSRTIYQINNGAAGAPYYAQEQTPWTPYVSNFTTQNALVFFHVRGKSIQVQVLNPDTLEEVDNYWIAE